MNFAITVVIINELVEGSVHFVGVNFPFSVKSLSSTFKLLSTDFLVDLLNVVADTGNGGSLVDIQIDELVRNNVHLLQRKGLNASSGETFENPALVVFLSFLNLLLDSIDNDIIFNVLEVSEALSNLLAVLVLSFVSNTAEGLTS